MIESTGEVGNVVVQPVDHQNDPRETQLPSSLELASALAVAVPLLFARGRASPDLRSACATPLKTSVNLNACDQLTRINGLFGVKLSARPFGSLSCQLEEASVLGQL